VKEQSYVTADIHLWLDGRRGSGISCILDSRNCGFHGSSCAGTHLGLGMASLVLRPFSFI
jgi:hypothetical protein